MHGKVHVWRMSEEERLEYIKRYPIKPYNGKRVIKTIGAFATEEEKKEFYNNRGTNRASVMDKVDKEKLHEMFMAGEKLSYIAAVLKISPANLSNYIKKQRKLNPDKWPRRQERRRIK